MSEFKIESAVSEYLAECDDITQRVNGYLRALDKGAFDAEIVDSLYRDVHTLKGSSQLFGFKQIGELTHAIESSLESVRRDQKPLRADHHETLQKCLDLVENVIRAIKSTGQESSVMHEVNSLMMDLMALSWGEPEAAAPAPMPEPVAAPAPPPVAVVKAVIVEEAAPEAAKPTSEAADAAATLRVPVTLLDKLMNLMGEMVLVRNQVLQYAGRSENLEFVNLSQRLDVVTSEIQGEIMKTRMQPIGTILSKFHRVTRDLAKELGKKIELTLIGTETELDKTLLEAVKDPIMHIVRNSCDHGIETIEERRKAGKNADGQIRVRSLHEGGQVIVEISDDGRGLDKDRIIKKAIEKGLLTAERAAVITDRDAYALIFAPGFSTAAAVTNVSGRGVGMDVVKTNIESIGGIVEVQSQFGRGTTTRLKIPLTLAIVPAMIIRSGQEQFAIPQVKLVELVRVEQGDVAQKIESLQGQPVLRLRGRLLPLVTLSDILQSGKSVPADQLPVANIVVLNADGVQFGLIVDEVLDTAEVVVKPLSSFLKSLLVYSGATVLGDGSVALILDIVGIAQKMRLAIESAAKKVDDGEVELRSEAQEFLLFRLNTPAKHAIPLNLVNRLEEFRLADIEYSGRQRFVRYRNSALPILSLNEQLGFAEMPAKETISVIVTQKLGRLFGIEVGEILDVLTTESQLEAGFSERAGVFGTIVSTNELIVVVDTMRIIDHVARALGTTIEAAPAPAIEAAKIKAKILFAEDTAFFRRLVQSTLENAGHIVTSCEHGLAAQQVLEKSRAGDFDLILSDIEMPKLNGLKLAEWVRGNEMWKRTPLVALTTKFNASHVEEGKRAGFDCYLEKLKAEILVAEIQTLLEENKRKAA